MKEKERRLCCRMVDDYQIMSVVVVTLLCEKTKIEITCALLSVWHAHCQFGSPGLSCMVSALLIGMTCNPYSL